MQIYLTTVSNDVDIMDLGLVMFTHPTVDEPLVVPDGPFTLEELMGSNDLRALIDSGQITLRNDSHHPVNDISVNSTIEWPALQAGSSVCGFSLQERANIITHKMLVPMECYAETNNGSDNSINYNNSSATYIRFSGDNDSNNGYFTWNSTTHRWVIHKASDSGKLAFNSTLNLYSSGYRVHVTARAVRVRGNNIVRKRLGSTYMRGANGHDRDTISGTQYFDYQAGDEFYVDIYRDGTYSTTTYINDYSNFSLRRIK